MSQKRQAPTTDKDNIEISANTNTLKSKMILNNNNEADFRQDKIHYLSPRIS